ncbi:MAG: hypothetical protein COA78_31485 [Blastopirellula sp.]|nr:MAG: hypothetical protein COA78_31485 [Blastopirellula sp.]
MSIQANCPQCNTLLEVDDIYAGKMARCPECDENFKLPEISSSKDKSYSLSGSLPETPSQVPESEDTHYYLRSLDKRVYGPVDKLLLEQWVTQGRVSNDCDIRENTSDLWRAASNYYPVLALPELMATGNPFGVTVKKEQTSKKYQTPHRGGLVLTFGILGSTFICPLFCLLAWVIGSMDILEMDAGRMDKSGYNFTRIGYFFGMAFSLIWILAISAFLLVIVMQVVI